MLRRAMFSRQRQRGLYLRYISLESFQLLALALIAHHNRRTIGTFYAEQSVQVSFVGRENDVEFRILQVEPRQVAREVIVAEQGIGPKTKRFRKLGVTAEVGRGSQGFGRRLQESAKRNAVGNSLQFPRMPSYDGELIVDCGFLIGMLLGELLDLIACHVCGIGPSPRRHGFGANKRLILVEQIEAGSVNPQITPEFDIALVAARNQRLV